MTDPQIPSAGGQQPTAKQLRYLKQLAIERGVSFVYPRTRAQASAEIQTLRQQRPDSYRDRRREQLEVTRDMACDRGDAARVRDHEISGWLASASWKTKGANR